MTNDKIAWLILIEDPGQRWPLEKTETIIGRRPPSDIVFPFSRISRRHARLERREFDYFLIDLGSRNGTFVNGQPVGAEGCRLAGGDEIVLGGAVSLRFEDPDETMQGPRLGRLQGIWIDPDSNDVWVDSLLLSPPLSAAQFTLLRLLYRANGGIVSRADIIAAVWPSADPSGVSEEAVDGLIKRLRQRLRQTRPQQDYLQVVRGRGLRLKGEG